MCFMPGVLWLLALSAQSTGNDITSSCNVGLVYELVDVADVARKAAITSGTYCHNHYIVMYSDFFIIFGNFCIYKF